MLQGINHVHAWMKMDGWMDETSGNNNDDACECDKVLSCILCRMSTDYGILYEWMHILCTLCSRVYLLGVSGWNGHPRMIRIRRVKGEEEGRQSVSVHSQRKLHSICEDMPMHVNESIIDDHLFTFCQRPQTEGLGHRRYCRHYHFRCGYCGQHHWKGARPAPCPVRTTYLEYYECAASIQKIVPTIACDQLGETVMHDCYWVYWQKQKPMPAGGNENEIHCDGCG